MTTPLQQTLDGLASTEKQQERLAAYLKEHEREILDYLNGEINEPSRPKKLDPKADPWSNPDIPIKSVETGIPDLAMNHDHYAWGTPKKYLNE